MKRFLCFVLCVAFLLGLSSCDDVSQESLQFSKSVAVKYASANEFAVDKYISQGYKKVTYNSSSDVVLAVEKGKADYGILDDFELNTYMSAKRSIKKKETCDFGLDYCAYFNYDNETLQTSFNNAIEYLKKDGTIEKIKNSYLKDESYIPNNYVTKKGTLIMLCDPSFENRVYSDKTGNIVGLDVDVAKTICNYLGYDLEIQTADFDELFGMLQDSECDFVITACEVSEEREELFLLSDVYFTLNYHLIERE